MYFIKRILFLVPLLLFISFLAFVLVHAMPGGPFDRERAPASPEIEHHLARQVSFGRADPQTILAISTASARRFRAFHEIPQSLGDRHHRGRAAGFVEPGALAFCWRWASGCRWDFSRPCTRRNGRITWAAGRGVGDLRSEPGHRADSHHAFRHQMRWFPVALWGSPWHAFCRR
jgi:hypothetical protein